MFETMAKKMRDNPIADGVTRAAVFQVFLRRSTGVIKTAEIRVRTLVQKVSWPLNAQYKFGSG